MTPKLQLALGNDDLTRATISGGRIMETTKDGFTTAAKLDGSGRTLARSDSKFKLNSTTDSDKETKTAADQIEKDLAEQLTPITKKLQTLDGIKRYLDTATQANTDPQEVKADIKATSPDLYAEL
jgi:Zn-dependent oligopeptidase